MNIGNVGLMTGLLIMASAGASPVVIQEVLYDGLGSDADEVCTELLGAPGVS